MKISLKCSCGCAFSISDPDNTYINFGGDLEYSTDLKYVIQKEAKRFTDAHEVCRKVTDEDTA